VQRSLTPSEGSSRVSGAVAVKGLPIGALSRLAGGFGRPDRLARRYLAPSFSVDGAVVVDEAGRQITPTLLKHSVK